MDKLKELEGRIEFLRNSLYNSIDANESLVIKQVVNLSQELDKVLNEYNSLNRELEVGFGC